MDNEMNELDKMLKEINKNELLCLFLTSLNPWISAIKEGAKEITYKDKIGIYGISRNAPVKLYSLHYNEDTVLTDSELVSCRFECVREIYYRWCFVKGIKPNPKEGWFKSKKFTQFLESINYNKINYVVMIVE